MYNVFDLSKETVQEKMAILRKEAFNNQIFLKLNDLKIDCSNIELIRTCVNMECELYLKYISQDIVMEIVLNSPDLYDTHINKINSL